MSNVENFLTQPQEQEIIDAIRAAEKNTSGEIRVHLEKNSEKDPLERAKEVFYFLKMDKTKNKNGVLFYVAVDDKKFSVLGDEGINNLVPEDFWNSIKDTVIQHFSIERYADGLKEGILATGQKLKEYFPFQTDDKDELSNEISSG